MTFFLLAFNNRRRDFLILTSHFLLSIERSELYILREMSCKGSSSRELGNHDGANPTVSLHVICFPTDHILPSNTFFRDVFLRQVSYESIYRAMPGFNSSALDDAGIQRPECKSDLNRIITCRISAKHVSKFKQASQQDPYQPFPWKQDGFKQSGPVICAHKTPAPFCHALTLAICRGCFCSLPPCSLKPHGAPPLMAMQR
ncbi:hypothetical protein DV515_00012639 [Chloebia gouldiae]|uniref:Uncharacterized protein n=1 Tax=Chloebia gouldiae TaxID=44316 RepID=A0A3L8S337_CHLGU|nr:hypothetical protein DV515_00012639 [Chloebia gouldiae]